METRKTTVQGRIEILANDHFAAIPIKVDDSIFTDGVVKAGTPLTAVGLIATGADAAGILLRDITTMNPNGALVVHGFIETMKAKNHSGVEVTAAMKTAMPLIRFS